MSIFKTDTPSPVLFMESERNISGGGQISLINLLRHIDRKLFTPYFVCSSSGNLTEKISGMGIRSEIVKIKTLGGTSIFSLPLSVIKLSRLVRKWGIKIIHSNAGVTRDTVIGALTAKILGIPFVWHVRVLESRGVLDRALTLLSARVIVISKAVSERFSGAGEQKKIEVICNGVDIDEFKIDTNNKGELRRNLNIRDDDVIIGTVGQLIPWKGHRYLIEAALKVKKKVPNAKFLLIGEEFPIGSGYSDELKELTSSLGLERDIIFTGFRKDIPAIMSIIDIFVLPSINEPFGRVLIEAMAMGKPVVATSGGGVPEIVIDGDTGILVPIKDPGAIDDAIVYLANNSEKAREMGLSGRRRVEKHFTIQQNVEKIQEVYLDVLKRND